MGILKIFLKIEIPIVFNVKNSKKLGIAIFCISTENDKFFWISMACLPLQQQQQQQQQQQSQQQRGA